MSPKFMGGSSAWMFAIALSLVGCATNDPHREFGVRHATREPPLLDPYQPDTTVKDMLTCNDPAYRRDNPECLTREQDQARERYLQNKDK